MNYQKAFLRSLTAAFAAALVFSNGVSMSAARAKTISPNKFGGSAAAPQIKKKKKKARRRQTIRRTRINAAAHRRKIVTTATDGRVAVPPVAEYPGDGTSGMPAPPVVSDLDRNAKGVGLPPPIEDESNLISPPLNIPKIVSKGVINGSATKLVRPEYPRSVKTTASGAVNVKVILDEDGSVVSAAAVSGHPLLRAAAVKAALESKFAPTVLSGQRVKVSGVIVYNFTVQ